MKITMFKFVNPRTKEEGVGVIWPDGYISTWSDYMGIATYSNCTTMEDVGATEWKTVWPNDMNMG